MELPFVLSWGRVVAVVDFSECSPRWYVSAMPVLVVWRRGASSLLPGRYGFAAFIEPALCLKGTFWEAPLLFKFIRS